MRQILTLALVFSTIRLATPLVLAALGGLYSERSGVINIALEGLLLAGAFTAASVTYYAHSPWVGLLAAIIAGAFVAYILAVACIRFKADQVVTGTGINILFIGLPAVLSGALGFAALVLIFRFRSFREVIERGREHRLDVAPAGLDAREHQERDRNDERADGHLRARTDALGQRARP